MPQTDLTYLPATEALARFAAKTLSPAELMAATIARAEAVQPALGAFTFTHYDEAMDLARAAEARWAKGTPLGPLDGLPVAVKDESMIAGKPMTNGSHILKDFVADTTSVANERILAAGGIVHARTATPEFSCAGICWSDLWGVTRNPWNRDITPGGSSGGSGAALAAGMACIATGSDIGGSIRIPASQCGIVGFKPPYGRIPEDPPFNLDFFCHNGPMARTVGDAILLENVMAGPSPRDVASLRPKLDLPMGYEGIEGWKIAFSPDLGCFEVDPEVRRNTESALDVFRALGATVHEVDLGWGPEVPEACLGYLDHLFGGYIAQFHDAHADVMTSYCRRFCELSFASTGRDFVRAMEVVGNMYATLGPVLEAHDLLICPTIGLPGVAADQDPAGAPLLINGKEVSPLLGWALTVPFNAMSRCPVLSVPSGFTAAGVPTGLQLVGRTYCDADVFRAGLAYERALGGWFSTPEKRPAV